MIWGFAGDCEGWVLWNVLVPAGLFFGRLGHPLGGGSQHMLHSCTTTD